MKKNVTDRISGVSKNKKDQPMKTRYKFQTETSKGFQEELFFSPPPNPNQKAFKSNSLERDPKSHNSQILHIQGRNRENDDSILKKEMQYIEKSFEGFWRDHNGRLNSNESAFIEYFKTLFDYITALSNKCTNSYNLLNSIMLVFGYPINLIFVEWQKLLKSIEDMWTEIHQIQKQKDKDRSETQKLMKIFSTNSNQKTIQKEIEELLHENVKLKSSLKRTKEMLKENRSREEKAMKLIYAIRMKGIDIEEIFNSSVQTPTNLSHREEHSESSEIEFVKQRLMEEWRENSSDSSTGQPVFKQPEGNPKFKLNLNELPKEGAGFHEEFMARLDEFSLSWRMAAMEEKKF